MHRLALFLVLLLVPARLAAQPADFAGSFSMPGEYGTIVVTLQPREDGLYSGTLSNGNLTWQLLGDIYEGALTGTVQTGQQVMAFEAHASDSELQLILVEIGPDGTPLVDQGQEFIFTRTSSGPGEQGGAGYPAPQGTPGRLATPGASGSGAPAQGGGRVDDSPLARQWRAHLAGKKVTYISSYSSNTPGGGGLSTRFVYHLCSDGRFAFSGSDVVSHNVPGAGVPGGGSAGSSGGTWRIVTQGQVAGIDLRFGNGQTELYRLDMQGGQTFANGERVYVTPGEMCY